MKELINPNFKYIDECEAVADYMEEHLYDTLAEQLPIFNDEELYEDYFSAIHAEAMEQVVAIMVSRFFPSQK